MSAVQLLVMGRRNEMNIENHIKCSLYGCIMCLKRNLIKNKLFTNIGSVEVVL